jgi:hypothetical protein
LSYEVLVLLLFVIHSNGTMMNSFSLTLLGINKIVTPITTPLKSNRIEEIVQEWYANFVNVDQTLLFELVTAANFMDIKALLDLTCLAVSILIKVSYPTRYFDVIHVCGDSFLSIHFRLVPYR